MRKTRHLTFALVLAAVVALVALAPAPALAAHLKGADGWSTTYVNGGTNGKLKENYPNAGSGSSLNGIADGIGHLQPGDDITFTISAIHENDKEADWYVSNDVVTSLEDSKAAAEGSNYEYLLKWEGPSESRTIYDSENVGGTGSNGLGEATSALTDFIFLERMKQGDSGKVTLKVTLNGETEGNAYFDTLAQLKVRFAVEPVKENTTTTQQASGGSSNNDSNNNTATETTRTRGLVRTGDDTRLFPLYVVMVVSGLALLGLAITGVRERRENGKEELR